MPSDFSLRERFWRDVVLAAGSRDLDPNAIREAVEDMMRNYRLDEVPVFDTSSEGPPDTSSFSEHSAFAPVFSQSTPNLLRSRSLGCFSAARPIFMGTRRLLRRRKTRPEPRDPDHFPGGGNPGVQADTDQPPNPPPVQATNAVSPWHHPPPLPSWTPQHYVWAFPTGHLAWSPHRPHPQPTSSVPQPLSPWSAIAATGGHPLPGTMPHWTPGTWPPLDWARDVPIRLSPHIIPNPNNAHLPMINWNVTKHPSTAKRLTPNHVVVDISSIWGDPVTHTKAHTLVVTCDVGHMSTLWGPVVLDHAEPVTLLDLFEAIYNYFQVPLTYPEVQYICKMHPSNLRRLTDAYYERCRESPGLPGWEAKQGLKRADVLGDRKYWWGVWIASRRGVWWLNLGLMNPAHRLPCP